MMLIKDSQEGQLGCDTVQGIAVVLAVRDIVIGRWSVITYHVSM